MKWVGVRKRATRGLSGSPTGALAVPFARCSRRQIRFEPFEYAFTVPLGGGAGPGIVIRFAAAVMPTLGSPAGATPISIRKAAGRRAKSGQMRHQIALTESKFRKEQPPNTHRLKVDTIPNLVNSFSTRSGETAAISIMLARRGEWHPDEIPTTAVGVIASLLQLVALLQHTFNPANGEDCILVAEAGSGNSVTLNPNGNGQHTEGHLGDE